MRLVYIFKSFAQKAGTERILSDKMNYLVREYGYEITFITYEQGDHPLVFELDKRIRVIDLDTRFFTLQRVKSPLRRFLAYREMKKRFRNRLEQVLREVNPDWVISTTYSFPLFHILLSLPYRHLVESHVSICDVINPARGGNPLKRLVLYLRDRRQLQALAKAEALVTLTEADAGQWRQRTPVRTHVIPNMLHLYPEDVIPQDERPRRIISVGRLHRQKGFDMLIEAWGRIASRHPEWRIDIYGQGEDRKMLEGEIHRRNLSAQLAIHPPVDNIYTEYQKSAFLAVSSRYEGFSLVIIESMSCGTPCVSFKCPHGPEDIITPGEDSLLVPPEDVAKLSESMEWMIEHEEERRKMGEKSRTKALQFTPERIMPLWRKLFLN